VATPAPAAKPIPVEKPFLWRVDGKNGPTYLFGTIHVGVNAETELPPSVWKAFNEAKVFAMEADLGKIDYGKVMALSQMPAGDKLSKHLSKEQFDLLLKLSGTPAAQLDSMQPWFSMIAVLQRAAAEFMITAMDLVFQKKASEQKKRLVYLEAADDQMEIIAKSLDAKVLARSLDQMIKEKKTTLDDLKQQIRDLMAAYRKGDTSYDFTKDSGLTGPALLEKILYERNRNWMPEIEKLVAEGNAFIAVGAMHLIGEKSVLDLLDKKGIKAVRIEK
jgi:uncharacterized protein YbaP (TraB family)